MKQKTITINTNETVGAPKTLRVYKNEAGEMFGIAEHRKSSYDRLWLGRKYRLSYDAAKKDLVGAWVNAPAENPFHADAVKTGPLTPVKDDGRASDKLTARTR